MIKEIEITVCDEQDGLPIKTVLSRSLHLSRREISRLKFSDGILSDGHTLRVTEPVHSGQKILLRFPEHDTGHAQRIVGKPEILYEDEDLVIVNKPAGMPCHPSHEHLDDDMGTLLQNYYGSGFTIRAVGRLDKDVSGVMLYAKNQPTAARLSKEREQDILRKKYVALAEGTFAQKKGTLQFHLTKKAGKAERVVSSSGQLCITEYQALEQYASYALLGIHIVTGRTHQIRAGFAGIGHPLLGDSLYGGKDLYYRPALHCASLSLVQPFTNKTIMVSAALPEDFKGLLEDSGLKAVDHFTGQ